MRTGTRGGRASRLRGRQRLVNKGRRRRRESVCLTRGPLRNNVVEHAVAVSLKGIDSSYLELVIPCSLHKLDDDLFPVMLFAELLSRSEGPLWNRIRGKGLAYHSLLEVLPWAGQLCFSLGECTAPAQALEEFLTILKEVEEEVEEAERQEEAGGGSAGEGAGEAAGKHMRKVLEESKASLLFSVHSRRSTPSSCASQAAKAYFWGVTEPMDEMERETQAIESVSLADLRRVFNRYFKSFLEPGNRCTVLVCPAGKGEGYATELEGLLGHPVKSCKVADFFAEV
uniref:Peptidase M16 C-terminal domain-containing protein n=1 Tax=Guillardia theta TaxID=55529 RepID=A0A7S4P4K8_GUITH|mmetsp:Transcript_42994/g.135849  ORF Transcript_42994/g.135849 Transcript_42994/m.135849 type:complete len:284 (+) Transcript_42994:537-1388(+)